MSQIREVLKLLGLQQDQYTGHSFCIGEAMTAAAAGVEDSTIETLTQCGIFSIYSYP